MVCYCYQALDILFCTLCMSTVVLYYAPISKQTHSALVLATVGMLAAPISNDPTNALNIILAIVCSVLLTLLLWLLHTLHAENSTLYKWLQSCFGYTVHAALNNNNKGQSRRSKYTIVAEDSQHGDIELSTTVSPIAETKHGGEVEDSAKSDSPEMRYAEEYSCRRSIASIYSFCLDVPHYLYDLRYCLSGLILSITGLMCFAVQSRVSYWYVHSLWHVFVMSSSLLLVKGRGDFMEMIEYAEHEV